MKEESTEPNGNDNYIKHRIVSWYGEHKMKLAFLFAVSILFGGIIYHVENENGFKITVDLTPDNVKIGQQMTLNIKIIPLKLLKGEFETEIKPESTTYITLHEEKAIFDQEKQAWVINLGELDLKVGMDRPYIYYLTGDTERSASTWRIDISVRYKQEGYSEISEEHHVAKYITVAKGDVPISLWEKIRQWLRRNTGHCLGTEMISLFVIGGTIILVKKRKKKEKNSIEESQLQS